MTHYSIYVLGDNIQELLAPYDENLQIESVHLLTEKKIQDFKTYYKISPETDLKKAFQKHGEDWTNEKWFEEKGVWKFKTTYNQQSKWDWYEIGGRWKNELFLKNGMRANQAFKKEISFDLKIKDAREFFTKKYRFVYQSIKKFPSHFITWPKAIEMSNNIEAAGILYRNQENVKIFSTFRNPEYIFLYDLVDDFNMSEEDYVKTNIKEFVPPPAYLDKDGWKESKKFGWWGSYKREINRDEWYNQFMNTFENLTDDTLVTVVDCHI